METLRFGVVGIGNMGSAHAVQLFEGRVKGAKLAAVCDCRRERLEWAGERLGRVPRYEDYETLLDSGEVDAVLIATPHKLHPVIAGEAFRRRLHVLTEKPAGIDTASVAAMNRQAEESGAVFGIMYNQRTNRLFRSTTWCRRGRWGRSSASSGSSTTGTAPRPTMIPATGGPPGTGREAACC